MNIRCFLVDSVINMLLNLKQNFLWRSCSFSSSCALELGDWHSGDPEHGNWEDDLWNPPA